MKRSHIGERIKNYREMHDLSVEELADRAGCAPELVAAVERGESLPALGWLVKMARVLGVRLGTFMDDAVTDDPHIVRRLEREPETAPAIGGKPALGQAYFSLGQGKADRHMEPFFIVLGSGEPEAPSSHEGEEFLIVVSGSVRLTYGRETYLLGPGDSAYYNSVVPHAVASATNSDAEIYAVVYAPF